MNTSLKDFSKVGYLKVPNAFPQAVADNARNMLWSEIGISSDTKTWKSDYLLHNKCYTKPPFGLAFSNTVCETLDELLGEGMWNERRALGYWPILFPTGKRPFSDWHIDGGSFPANLDFQGNAMVLILLFTDIGPKDGGTELAVGSHRSVMNEVKDSSTSSTCEEVSQRIRSRTFSEVHTIQGSRGDAFFLHPFLAHRMGVNSGTSPRLICNMGIDLKNRG